MKNADPDSVLEKLIGSWSLVSWESHSDDGSASYPLGEDALGQLMYDADKAAVTHHIESGWFPNLVGTQQVRYHRFDGERLVLDADTAAECGQPMVMASSRSLMNAEDVTGSRPATRPIGGASGVTTASWLAS